MSHGLSLTTVPKDLYYVEMKLVADQAAEIKRLRKTLRINNTLRDTLLAIKALCAGDKIPNWTDDLQTTHTRGRIMDLVDSVVR